MSFCQVVSGKPRETPFNGGMKDKQTSTETRMEINDCNAIVVGDSRSLIPASSKIIMTRTKATKESIVAKDAFAVALQKGVSSPKVSKQSIVNTYTFYFYVVTHDSVISSDFGQRLIFSRDPDFS